MPSAHSSESGGRPGSEANFVLRVGSFDRNWITTSCPRGVSRVPAKGMSCRICSADLSNSKVRRRLFASDDEPREALGRIIGKAVSQDDGLSPFLESSDQNSPA